METRAEFDRQDAAASPTGTASGSGIVGPSSLRLTGKLDMLVLGALLLVAFWPILISMYGSWFDENAYMEHGILVIPAAAYMAWTQKDKLKATPLRPSGWGVMLLLWGALQALLGLAAQWVWVSRMSFLISLVGYLAAVFGWRIVRELMYPLATLILMITPPTFIFERLTLSLQLLASRLGEFFLELLGYSVLREGNILEMVGIKLSVEEACSGIRSLVAIFFMCVLYNYFFVQGRSMKALLLVMAIPIAIFGNAVRIVATGVASQYNPALVSGTAHEMFGYVSVVAAALGVVAFHLGLKSILKTSWIHHA
ncbi:MAG: exosortase/archaeosortase family protein [Bryobacteraceae bacterium]